MDGRIAGLSEADISAALRGEASAPSYPEHGLVRAAVLIPFLRSEGSWQILFTRRTEHLETHKGQVAFPGGAADAGDASPEETALRETYEEIGIQARAVRLLGRMRATPTVTRFLVTPVVGVIDWPVPLILQEREVSRVFRVPLAWLADERNHEERLHERRNGTVENVVFFQPYDGETIWGVTGGILHELLGLLSK